MLSLFRFSLLIGLVIIGFWAAIYFVGFAFEHEFAVLAPLLICAYFWVNVFMAEEIERQARQNFAILITILTPVLIAAGLSFEWLSNLF